LWCFATQLCPTTELEAIKTLLVDLLAQVLVRFQHSFFVSVTEVKPKAVWRSFWTLHCTTTSFFFTGKNKALSLKLLFIHAVLH